MAIHDGDVCCITFRQWGKREPKGEKKLLGEMLPGFASFGPALRKLARRVLVTRNAKRPKVRQIAAAAAFHNRDDMIHFPKMPPMNPRMIFERSQLNDAFPSVGDRFHETIERLHTLHAPGDLAEAIIEVIQTGFKLSAIDPALLTDFLVPLGDFTPLELRITPQAPLMDAVVRKPIDSPSCNFTPATAETEIPPVRPLALKLCGLSALLVHATKMSRPSFPSSNAPDVPST